MWRSCNQLAILLSRTYLNNTHMMLCGPESDDRKARGGRITNPMQRRATLRARLFGRNPAGWGPLRPGGEAKGTSDQAPRGCDGGFPGWDARSEAQRMVDPLRKPSDKADRPESPVPPGCGKMRRLRRCAPRLRRLNYDLRRAPRIHPHFARNAIRGGLNQRFLKCGSGSMSAPLVSVSCGSLRPCPLHAARVRVRGALWPFRRCSPLIWNNQTARLAPRTVIKIAAVARADIVEIGSALNWQILR